MCLCHNMHAYVRKHMISVTELLEVFLLFIIVKDCTFWKTSSPTCWINTLIRFFNPELQLHMTYSYTTWQKGTSEKSRLYKAPQKPSEFSPHRCHRQVWIRYLNTMNIWNIYRIVQKQRRWKASWYFLPTSLPLTVDSAWRHGSSRLLPL